MTTWALIGCTKTKQTHNCIAGLMYWRSALFRGAWLTAKANDQTPLILSAKYGLLRPDQRIDPYDETLIGRPREEREVWARSVLHSLTVWIKPGDRVVSYLGSVYAEYVIPELRVQGYQVDEPLLGMGIGRRLHWFKEQLEGVKSHA